MTRLLMAAAVVLVGMLVLAWGVRGRRLDRHPCCRRCGYDLVGSGAGPTTCPECGASLARRRAKRVGRRRKRPVVMTIGALAAAGGTTWGAFIVWPVLERYDWNRVKPVWVLVREADRGTTVKALAAQDELLRRLDRDRLSDRQIETLVRDALALQADPSRPWPARWGTFIEAAWYGRYVDDTTVQAYLRGAYAEGLDVALAPRAAVGGPIAFEVSVPLPRGSDGGSVFTTHFQFTGVRLDDRYAAVTDSSEGHWSLVPRTPRRGARIFEGAASAFAEPGRYTLTLEYSLHFTVRESARREDQWRAYSTMRRGRTYGDGYSTGVTRPAPPPDGFFEWRHEAARPVEIVPPGTPVLDLVEGPALAEAMHDAIVVDTVVVSPLADGRGKVHVQMTVVEPPVDAVFEVSLRTPDASVPLSSTVRARPGQPLTVRLSGIVPAHVADADAVEVVLDSPAPRVENVAAKGGIWKGRVVRKHAVTAAAAVALGPDATTSEDAPRPLRTASIAELLERGRSEKSGVARRGLAELDRRRQAGELEDVADLVDRALDHQADDRGWWHEEWGDFVEEAWAEGHVEPGALERYLRTALGPLGLEARPRVRAGEPIPFAVRLPGFRAGRGRPVRLAIEIEPQAASIGGAPVALDDARGGRWPVGGTARERRHPRGSDDGRRRRDEPKREHDADLGGTVIADVAPGRHTLAVKYCVRVIPFDQRVSFTWTGPRAPRDDDAAPLLEWTIGLSTEIDVLGADRPTVVLDRRPESVDATRRALSIRGLKADVHADATGRRRLRGTIRIAPRPVHLAFDAVLVLGGEEHRAGTVVVPASAEPSWSRVSAAVLDLDPALDRAGLVLRPNPALVERSLDVTKICGAEIELPDLRLEFSRE